MATPTGSPLKTAEKPLRAKAAIGRPPKYSGPSRPFTVTLPEETLEALGRINPDRGQAIVKLVADALRESPASEPLVEIVEMAANTGLLLVGPSKLLPRISFLHLVEVAPARFLLALDPGNDFKNLELAVLDVLEDEPDSEPRERELVDLLLEKIRRARKAECVSMAEILFVKLGENRGGIVNSLLPTVSWLCAAWL